MTPRPVEGGLSAIPIAGEPPADAVPSPIVAHLRSTRPSRRTMVRGLLLAAAAAALVPLDWFLTRRAAAAAEPRTDGDDRSEHLGCAPESYREEANNWPESDLAVCYGGWRRGTYPCSEGYHREGSYTDGEDSFESTRVTQSCHGKNAWRWKGYRCSDAMTTVTFADGTDYSAISIASCALGDAEAAPTTTGSAPTSTSAPTSSGRSRSSAPTSTRSAPSTTADEDPAAQPRGGLLTGGL